MLSRLSPGLHAHLMKGKTDLFPLVPVAGGMVVAILAAASFRLTRQGLFWGGVSTLAALVLIAAWDRASRVKFFGGIIAGILLTCLHLWAPWQTYQRHAAPRAAATLTVRLADPFCDPGPFGPGTRRRRLTAHIQDIMLAGAKEPTASRGKILLVMPRDLDVEYGETLQVEGVFSKPQHPVPAGTFDYRRFLLSTGIQHVFTVRSVSHKDQPTRTGTIRRCIFAGRRILATRLIDGFKDKRSAQTAVAMTLGYRQTLPYEIRQQFIRSGTIHIFSISGLHVGIATTVFLLLARIVGLPLKVRFRLLPLLLGLYVILTGSPTSAVRAWVMISAFSLSYSSLRAHVPLNGLALAALILLFVNPLALFNTGFQFSFLVVIALIAGWRSVRDTVHIFLEKRTWTGQLSMPKYRLYQVVRFGIIVAGCGLAAWLGGAGLLAWNNCLLIPAALWLNVAVSLLAFGSLSLAMVKLAWVCCGLSCLTGPVTGLLEFCLTMIRSLAASVAGGRGCLAIPQPPLWLVVMYYGVLLVLILPGVLPKFKKMAGIFLLLTLGWIGFGNRIMQKNLCIFIHGRGGRTACIVEKHAVPPVFILSGDSWLDLAALDVLKIRGHDTVQSVVCPRYGSGPDQSAIMVSERIGMEHFILSERSRLNRLWSGQAVSILDPSAKLTRGYQLPPGLQVKRFSGNDLDISLRDICAGHVRVNMRRQEKCGMTHCRASAGGRGNAMQLSLPNTKEITVLNLPYGKLNRPQ